jgi:hypothetical protein
MKKVIFLMKIKEAHSDNFTPAMFNWYGILEYLGYEVMYEDYSNYNPDNFLDLVKKEKPDYIFHPTYDSFHSEFVRLREFSKVYCIHSDDDWRFDNFTKFYIPFTDGAIGYQNNENCYLDQGANAGYYNRARWAFNPNMMHYNFDNSKKYGLTHLGGLHGNKKQKIDQLTNEGLKIELIDPKFNNYSEYLEYYQQSIASICLTTNSLGTFSQSKTRLAEIPYYCVLISESWPDMHLWNMEPNKDFILIDDSKNYIELINKCLRDTKFADTMYNSAKSILLNNNTVFHEWNRIMKNIDEDYKEVDIHTLIKTFKLI